MKTSSERPVEKQWDTVLDDFNVTILCCHTFNFKCLVGWGGKDGGVSYGQEAALESNMLEDDKALTCPLCRYFQNPQQLSHCDDCGVTDNYFE